MSNKEDDEDKINDVDSTEVASRSSEISKEKKFEDKLLEDLPEEALMKMVLSSGSISARSSF